ncbi:MAG: TetR/AcrR family transcriptional regulator [Acutalibacteraceae bacterium]
MKDEIICQSIESLRQEGLRFSVDTLAKRLNISKKTIYKYFPTKEALAFALYQKYYTDIKAQAVRLTKENSVDTHKKLLSLYFDAKSMTSYDIFNKYKLNEALCSYTSEQNDKLLEIIFLSLKDSISQQDKKSVSIIINGTFEKLCNEKIAPDGVIDRLVNILW